MRPRVRGEQLRRRGAAGPTEVRRLRAGIFRLGGYVGFETQAIVRISEVISGQRWKRCSRADLERVMTDLALIAKHARSKGASDVEFA